MIKLLFTSKNTIGSFFIRLFTWSKWSHVALWCSDGAVIESIGFAGVRKVSHAEALKGANKYAIVEFKDLDEQSLIEVLTPEIGKSYDFLGAIGIGLFRNWQHNDKWICSELIAWGFEKIGHPLFRADQMYKISQQNIWELAPVGNTTLIRVD